MVDFLPWFLPILFGPWLWVWLTWFFNFQGTQEIVHPLQNLPFHFALSLPCMCFVFPGVYTAQSTGDRPAGCWPGGLGQSLLIPTEGCVRRLDYCKWCFGSVPLLFHADSSFLYLLWYRFPLLALGFPNRGHRDSVWTRVTLKALILPRVCWSLNSFPWPEGPAGSQQSPSILHLHPQLRPSHLAHMALAMLLFFILCRTLSGLWTSVLSCLFLLYLKCPSHGSHSSGVSKISASCRGLCWPPHLKRQLSF